MAVSLSKQDVQLEKQWLPDLLVIHSDLIIILAKKKFSSLTRLCFRVELTPLLLHLHNCFYGRVEITFEEIDIFRLRRNSGHDCSFSSLVSVSVRSSCPYRDGKNVYPFARSFTCNLRRCGRKYFSSSVSYTRSACLNLVQVSYFYAWVVKNEGIYGFSCSEIKVEQTQFELFQFLAEKHPFRPFSYRDGMHL